MSVPAAPTSSPASEHGRPRPFLHLSLKWKFALVAGLLLALTIATITAVRTVRVREQIKSVLATQQFSLVTTVAEDIEDRFKERRAALISVAQALPPEITGDAQRVQQFIESEHALAQQFNNLLVFTPQGRMIADVPHLEQRRGLSIADRPYFQRTLESKSALISPPLLGRTLKRPQVVITAPVLDAEGHVTAVLVGSLNLLDENFLGGIADAKLGRTGYFYIVSNEEPPIIVAHPSKDLIMTPVQGRALNPGSRLALAGYEGSEEGVNSRGVHGLFSYKNLRDPNWTLAAVLPAAEAFAPVAAAQREIVLTGLAALLVSMPLLWLFTAYLIAPMTALRAEMTRLRTGGAGRTLPIRRRDEIGDLTREFNALMHERQQATAALQESETRLRTITDNLPALIGYVDRDLRYRFNNSTYETWYGVPRTDLTGRTIREILGDAEFAKMEEALHKALAGETVSYERELKFNGVSRFAHSTYLPHRDATGRVVGFYALVTDISAQKAVEQALTHAAHHDPLTGLPNRALFEDRLQEAIQRCVRHHSPLALCYLDIDHFKRINDSLGHAAGDELLRQFAGRLRESVRSTDTVARLGGDEFVIILENLQGVEDARQVAGKILESMKRAFCVQDQTTSAATSIGIGYTADGNVASSQLLKCADEALYNAKANGRGNYVLNEATPAA